MPVAMVPSLADAEIVTDYCIGAVGKVRTVVVMSNTPIEKVSRIYLDAHSKTSVQLCGYLAKKLWHIEPEWIALEDYSQLDHAKEGDAFLLIRDKVFDNEGRFVHSYDLAEEWQKATKMPFTFAVWVARKGLSYEVRDELQAAFTYGVEHIYEAILESDYADREYAYEYLTENIDFLFDIQKHNALKKFWDYGLKIEPKVNPG
jgi:chorismate dehydratase